MDRTFYNGPSTSPGASGGANIARAKLQAAITDSTQRVAAKLFGWKNTDELGERSYEIEIYPHTGTTFDVEIDSGTVVWVIRRADAKNSSGRYGRWELLSGPPGGGGDMTTIPFRNDSGETAPAYGVMEVIEVDTESRTATVDTGTDVWTLGSAVTWSTPVRLRYQGSPPTTSPSGEITSGGTVWGRMLSTTTLTLHPTEADANANSNVINCTTGGSSNRLFNLDVDEFLVIKKPKPTRSVTDRPSSRVYVVNEGTDVVDGETGLCRQFSCSYGYPVRALFEKEAYYGLPEMGDVVGPQQDSWHLAAGRAGFVVLGNYDEDSETVTVLQDRERVTSGSESDRIVLQDHSNLVTNTDCDPHTPQMVVPFGSYNGDLLGQSMPVLRNSDASYNGTRAWGNHIAILDADGLTKYQEGIGTLAINRPAWVKYNADIGTPILNYVYGPFPGSDMVHPGLPGFTCINFNSTLGLMLVLADSKTVAFDAIAYGNWEDTGYDPWVVCRPYDRYNAHAYDGNDGYPDFKIVVSLPKGGSGRDPNVRTGNLIKYAISASTGAMKFSSSYYGGKTTPGTMYGADHNDPLQHRFVCVTPYLDDKIGTVKMWIGSTGAIPQGWREYTAMRDRFPIGVNSTAGSVGATGGATTHTHTTATGGGVLIAGGATTINSANHLPPYSGIYFIERFQ